MCQHAPISADRLRRTVAFAATLAPAKARALLGALVCAASPLARSPQRVELANAHFAKREPLIAAMHAAIVRHLDYAKHETLRKLEKAMHAQEQPIHAAAGGVAFDLVFDQEEFADGLLAAVRKASAKALHTAGNEFLEELGRDDVWTMPDPKAKAFLDKRANLLKDVSAEVHKAIEDEVKAGMDAGDSLAETAKRITAKFDEIGSGRAMTIASTETSAAYGFARGEAMRAAGIQYKRWLTSGLPNVRDAHAEAEDDERNQRVPVDEPFMVDGEELMYPGDENGSPGNVINCHCIALAVTPEEEDEEE